MNKPNVKACLLLSWVSCMRTTPKQSIDEVRETASMDSYCKDYKNETIELRAQRLISSYRQLRADGKTNENNDKAYFCLFPSTFQEMEDLFGYSDGPGPLYDSKNLVKTYDNKDVSHSPYIFLFSTLKNIPNEVYFKKYIEININGVWKADHIEGGFLIARPFLENTFNFSKVLKSYSDEDIHSVFTFIFDGPHPDDSENHALFKELRRALGPVDTRLESLLEKAFTELLANENHHH